MRSGVRRNHTPLFKATAALAAIKGEKRLAELAPRFDVPPNRITSWKAQLLDGAASPDYARGLARVAQAVDQA
jgi:transposase